MLARPRTLLYESPRNLPLPVTGKGYRSRFASYHLGRPCRNQGAGCIAGVCRARCGWQLVNMFLQEARELAIPQVFVLTYQQKFFEKCGFKVISKESLPQKVWKECVNCPKFPNCEEIAMIYSPMTTTG